MNLEEWSVEIERLYKIIADDPTPPRILLAKRWDPSQKLHIWRAECASKSPEEGKSAILAMEAMLISLRRSLAYKIEEQKKALQKLLTLENEAAIKMLETPETITDEP